MKFILSMFAVIFAMSFGQAHAMQATPTGNSGGSLGYTCTNNEGQTASCSCVGFDDCQDMYDSGVCETKTEPDGTTVPDTTCTSGFRNCSCNWSQLEGDAFGWRQEVQSSSTNMAPADASPARVERRGNEVVPARRGSPRTTERITDGTSNTSSSPESSIIAPNNIVAPNNRGTRMAPEIARSLRQEALASQSNGDEARRNEVVPARRSTSSAPSDVTLSDIGRTSLTLEWQDNTLWEYGVEVERGIPARERGAINYNWQRVFNVEERVMSRVEGTGTRSDGDDGLTPATQYCYRLRAYGQRSFSDYSEPVCARTLP